MRSTLRSVGESVAALRAALRTSSAEEIEAQVPVLQEAAIILERLTVPVLRDGSEGRPAEPAGAASRQELEAVAKELRAAEKLITQGVALTQGMGRLLAPAAEYRQDGEPASVQPVGRLLLRG